MTTRTLERGAEGWHAPPAPVGANRPDIGAHDGTITRLGEGKLGPMVEPRWENFFGRPDPSKSRFPISNPLETQDLPEAYRGSNNYMTKIVIRLITSQDTWPTSEVLPWKETRDMSIEWDEYLFHDHLLDPLAHEVPPRLVSTQRRHRKVGMRYWGLAALLEHGFMMTEEGQRTYKLNLQQIANAIVMTNKLGAMQAILHAVYTPDGVFSSIYAVKYPLAMFRKVYRQRMNMFAVLQVRENGVLDLEQYGKDVLQSRNEFNINTLILPQGAKAFVGLKRPEMLQPLLSTQAAAPSPNRSIRTIGTYKVFESSPCPLQTGDGMIDPFFRPRSHGGWMLATHAHLHSVKPQSYRSSMMNIIVYDEDRDDNVVLKVEDMFQAAMPLNWDEFCRKSSNNRFGEENHSVKDFMQYFTQKKFRDGNPQSFERWWVRARENAAYVTRLHKAASKQFPTASGGSTSPKRARTEPLSPEPSEPSKPRKPSSKKQPSVTTETAQKQAYTHAKKELASSNLSVQRNELPISDKNFAIPVNDGKKRLAFIYFPDASKTKDALNNVRDQISEEIFKSIGITQRALSSLIAELKSATSNASSGTAKHALSVSNLVKDPKKIAPIVATVEQSSLLEEDAKALLYALAVIAYDVTTSSAGTQGRAELSECVPQEICDSICTFRMCQDDENAQNAVMRCCASSGDSVAVCVWAAVSDYVYSTYGGDSEEFADILQCGCLPEFRSMVVNEVESHSQTIREMLKGERECNPEAVRSKVDLILNKYTDVLETIKDEARNKKRRPKPRARPRQTYEQDVGCHAGVGAQVRQSPDIDMSDGKIARKQLDRLLQEKLPPDQVAKLFGLAIKLALDTNAPPPCAFLILRPHVAHLMGSAVMCERGSALGNTFYGFPDLQLSDDTARKMHYANFTGYFKPLVTEPRKLVRIDDVYSKHYLGGGGSEFFDPSKYYDGTSTSSVIREYVDHLSAENQSLFSTIVPWDYEPPAADIDITGHFGGVVGDTQPHYPSAPYYASVWGWRADKIDLHGQSYEYDAKKPREQNTVCSQDFHVRWEPTDSDGGGGFKRYVTNKGAFGERVYPGCGKIRDGALEVLRPVDYNSTSVVSIVS